MVDAECAYSRSGEGLHRFADPADGNVYMYSDLETFDANRVYACFDQPDMKAHFELTVRAPQEWTVVSNMAADVEGGSPDGAGVRRWHFPPTPLMATYITHVSAGPWHIVRDSHDGIPLGIFCRQSLARYLDPDEIFEVTRQGFDFYHQAFGIKYPFGKYDQLFVPEFKEGAMENAGAVTFLEDYVFRSRVTDFSREARGETILHEMAHMWFGDLVTMRWWDDLWLNESFATWAGTAAQAEATRWTQAWTTFTTAWKAWAYKQDQLPSTHPIAADIPDIHAVEVNFDGITYAKGAAVLKQLVAYVGRENFLAGVRKYFAGALLRQRDPGRPALRARGRLRARPGGLVTGVAGDRRGQHAPALVHGRLGRPLHLLLGVQEAAASHPVLRSHRIAIGLYSLTDGGLTQTAVIETDVVGRLHRGAGPDRASPARPRAGQRRGPHLRQDPARRPLAAHRGRLDRLVHLLAAGRAGLGGGLGHVPGRGDGRPGLRPAGARRRGLGARHQRGADAAAAGDAGGAALRRAVLARGGPRADGVVAAVAARLRPGRVRSPARLRARASPGWPPRRPTCRSWPGCSTGRPCSTGSRSTPTCAGRCCAAWSAGRCSARRRSTPSSPSDATDAGERQAAACRAAVPSVKGKRETWETLTDGKLTIAMFRATLAGFADPDQRALVEPYRPEYFAAVGEVWREWSSAIAQDFVEGGYSVCAVDEATVEATDAYLASSPEPPAALRRLLNEGRDEVLRALRNQSRDREAACPGAVVEAAVWRSGRQHDRNAIRLADRG